MRHPRGWRAFAGAEGEDMQESQVAIGNQPQRVFEHLLGLGRETGDDIGAKDDVGPQSAGLFAETDRVFAQVAALHPL